MMFLSLHPCNTSPEEEARQRDLELQVLHDLSQQLSYQLTYEDVLRLSLKSLCRIIPQEVCGYIIEIGKYHSLSLFPNQLISSSLASQIQHHLTETLTVLSGKSAIAPSTEVNVAQLNLQDPQAPPLDRLGSMLLMPITIAETHEIVGLLLVGTQAADAYSESQMRFLNCVATQSAIALQRLHSLLTVGHQRLYSMVENLPDGIILLDTQGNILLANQIAWKYIALLTKAGCSDIFTQIMPLPASLADSPLERRCCHELIVEGHPPLILEFVAQRAIAAYQTEEWQLVIRDITAAKQNEAELVRYVQQLTTSNAELERFAYIAAHDLQAPLFAVSGYLQVLKTYYHNQLDPQADRFIAEAVNGAKRMQQLIEDLLAYARIDAQPLVPEPIDFQTILQQALSNLQGAIATTGASISADPLPVAIGDPGQLVQLFQNLIGNAIKYQQPHVAPQVQIQVEIQPEELLFSIRDNGIGIAPQHAEQVFHLFKRLHSSAEYPGTGIGLAIAKKIVEQHGGRIWCSPAPESGSIFSFTLPTPVSQNP